MHNNFYIIRLDDDHFRFRRLNTKKFKLVEFDIHVQYKTIKYNIGNYVFVRLDTNDLNRQDSTQSIMDP